MIPAIIVDLDGTLADCEHRRHFVEAKNWDAFYGAMAYDKPADWCCQLIFAMSDIGYKIIFVSGRPEEYRSVTEAWLGNHGIIHGIDSYRLFMRPTGDYRRDDVVKSEIYRLDIEPHFDVRFCVDDRKQVVDMWRRLGLTCLQCAEGDF